jgi:hypothetical protein
MEDQLDYWSQFQQSICAMHRGASMKKMVQKMLFCFTNISANILLHFFMLQLLQQAAHFVAFLTHALVFKSIKSYLRKSCSTLASKMFV